MSLISCPNCGRQVSAAAPACIQCGRPLAVHRPALPPVDPLAGAKTMAHVVYGLYAASYVVGLTWLAAVVLAYAKKDEARGTWLESHFEWAIATFWLSLFWGIGLVLVALFFGLTSGGDYTGFGFVLLLLVLGGVGLFAWTVYRIAKGWMRLAEGRLVQ